MANIEAPRQHLMANDAQGAERTLTVEKPVRPTIVTVSIIFFVASGVAQPLLSSQVKYMGLGNPAAQIYMVPYFAGMTAVSFLYFCIPSKRWYQYKLRKSCGIALIDVISQTLNYTGNNMAGSSVFSVIYSSVSIWCAVLSWMLGLRKLNLLQWLTVFVVCSGLVVSALDSMKAGDQIALGSALVILGSFLHAAMYTLSEFISVRGGEEVKIPPHIHCSTMGVVETTILTLWQLVYTIPHWDEAIGEPMEQKGTTWVQALLILAAIAFANWLHSVTFFFLLKWLGAVSAAVMKGLQAILVFLSADLIFCDGHHEQCLDAYKWASLCIVICGVLLYGIVTSRSQA